MKSVRSGLLFGVFLCAASSLIAAQNLKVIGSIKIGGTGGWDYLTADSPNGRLYVSHGTQVEVIDLASNTLAGKIAGMNRIHGIAIANDLGRGFITDGGSNEIVVFDLKTLAVQTKVKAGTNPDGVVYDPSSQRVFAFNGRSQNATVVDASNSSVVGTIALDGKPEFPVADGRGNVYANIEDKSEIVAIDAKTLAVKAHWPLAPCESPSGLAIDTANRRLFSVCDNKMMAVVDADSGKVLATPAIGDGPDAAGYDPGTKLAFSSNGDGTLTVVHDTGHDHYAVVQNVSTAKGARTMTVDTKTHKVYLVTASFGPAPAPTADRPHPRPEILPETFKVLIVGK
ncbi:MAG: YncE family protein [Acidobacteriaceae bacterium]|nr:YncE family protein [Acidobacteriaceae bacterium]